MRTACRHASPLFQHPFRLPRSFFVCLCTCAAAWWKSGEASMRSAGTGPPRGNLRAAPRVSCCCFSALECTWISGGGGEFQKLMGSARHLKMPLPRLFQRPDHGLRASQLATGNTREGAAGVGREDGGQLPTAVCCRCSRVSPVNASCSHGSAPPNPRLCSTQWKPHVVPPADAGHALSMPMFSPSRSMYYAMQAGSAGTATVLSGKPA